jgi:hypothetical protein
MSTRKQDLASKQEATIENKKDKTHLQKRFKDSLVVDGKENCLSIFLYQHQCLGQNTYLIKHKVLASSKSFHLRNISYKP